LIFEIFFKKHDRFCPAKRYIGRGLKLSQRMPGRVKIKSEKESEKNLKIHDRFSRLVRLSK